jgi:ABC-type transporter MlaC component
MKHTLFAVLATTVAMLVTSGIVAFVSAAQPTPSMEENAEKELATIVDGAITRQLEATKVRLGLPIDG